jgi:hypothetical protein
MMFVYGAVPPAFGLTAVKERNLREITNTRSDGSRLSSTVTVWYLVGELQFLCHSFA